MPDQNIGKQLGNYRLTRLVGQGSFADVYLGEHVYLNTHAAIKVLRATLDEGGLEQFLSEARTVARLKHPHIVRVLDFGVENGTPFFVMEYAAKGTLRDRHPKKTQLPLDVISLYVQQVASALQYAHDQKLIHRDIKPKNILLGDRDELLLSDFGIATVAQSSRYEQLGSDVAGTGAYMAPEQLMGKPRPASDQYSLGIMTYEWLTGELPFQGSFFEVASQHSLKPAPSPLERRPALAPAIAEVVAIALAKDPAQRFGSVQAFAKAFEGACKQIESPAPHLPVPQAPSPTLMSTQAELDTSARSGEPASFSIQQSSSTKVPFGDLPTMVTGNNLIGDLPTMATGNNLVEQPAPRPAAYGVPPRPDVYFTPPPRPDVYGVSPLTPPIPAARPTSQPGSAGGRRLLFIALSVLVLASLAVASFFVLRGPTQSGTTGNEPPATATVAPTATPNPNQPYVAQIPGPECNPGVGQWSSYGSGSMQCLADSLQLTGNPQQKFAVAFWGVAGMKSWPVNYTFSVEVSSIQAGACVDLLTSIEPDWYRIYLCSDNTATAQYDDAKTTTSLKSKTFPASGRFTLKITCKGTIYTFFVNDVQITSDDHGQLVATKGVSFSAISGTAKFQNFMFTPQA